MSNTKKTVDYVPFSQNEAEEYAAKFRNGESYHIPTVLKRGMTEYDSIPTQMRVERDTRLDVLPAGESYGFNTRSVLKLLFLGVLFLAIVAGIITVLVLHPWKK
jgi:hypothetical protein